MAWSDIFADPAEHERIDWGRSSARFTASPDTTALLSFRRIDDWIRYGHVRYPQFQLNTPSGGVPPTMFTVTRPYLALSMPGYPDTDAIAAQLEQGATLRFVNIEDWYAPMAALADRLTRLLNATIATYAFYTPPGDDGVGAHFDSADVFALQIEGTKTWHLWDIPDGTAWQESQTLRTDRAPDQVVELRPGDGLYIPAGMGHRAFAGPEGTLHLSIAVRPTSHREIVRRWAEDLLAAIPRLERLPIHGDRVLPVTELLNAIAAAAAKTDPTELLARADVHRPNTSDTPLIAGVLPRSAASRDT
ncbi:cupin domain-containing protein [Actinomadura sp. NPDC047616]|uniref:JmjC domain-containing protein n=1 Tax=Actinomadura sp. NPDC047616 TaxID=3155914 RepID=UPI0033E12A0C